MTEQEGLRDVENRTYYSDGSLESVFMTNNGQKNGKETVYFRNSTEIKSQSNYVQGVLDGEHKEVSRSGDNEGTVITKTIVLNYKSGVLDGSQKEEIVYDNYKRDNSIAGKGPKSAKMIDMARESEKKRNTATTISEYDNGVKIKEITAIGFADACEMTYKDGVEWEGQRCCKQNGKTVQYGLKEGKLDGFYKEISDNGMFVLVQKRYKDGVDVTAKYESLKKAAAKNISPDKTVTPKQPKLTKVILGLKEKVK